MTEQRDFFISFTKADEAIATALNEALRAAGRTTYFHPVDKPLGAGIAGWMADALNASRRMIAACSPTYFDPEKGYSASERYSIFMEDPTNASALLLMARVADFAFPRPFNQNEYIDVVGMNGAETGAHLVGLLANDEDCALAAEADSLRAAQRTPEVFRIGASETTYFTGRQEGLVKAYAHPTRHDRTDVTYLELSERNAVWLSFSGRWKNTLESLPQI